MSTEEVFSLFNSKYRTTAEDGKKFLTQLLIGVLQTSRYDKKEIVSGILKLTPVEKTQELTDCLNSLEDVDLKEIYEVNKGTWKLANYEDYEDKSFTDFNILGNSKEHNLTLF